MIGKSKLRHVICIITTRYNTADVQQGGNPADQWHTLNVLALQVVIIFTQEMWYYYSMNCNVSISIVRILAQ